MQHVSSDAHRVFNKCAWRLIPFILLLYFVNYVDRVNVGFAALTMNRDLGLSPAVFGLGAGIFFVGYSLFQVPANVILHKLGARRWIFFIVLTWGAVSAANALVSDAATFYTLRLILGIAEAGFFPGVLFYLTFWFPQSYRARFTAAYMAAIPLSFVIGGPVSGVIMQMDGIGGLHGWQWLFIVEGLPACLLAFAVLKLLPDGPAQAEWLTAEEKKIITTHITAEDSTEKHDLWSGLRDPRILGIGMTLLGSQFALYGVQLWLPQIVAAMGFSTLLTGFVVAVPFFLSMIAMIVWGRMSDARRERIWHIALPALFAAGGLIFASQSTADIFVLAGLTIGLIGILSISGPIFSLPSSFLAGTAAAGGIALVNMMGSFGRFLGPTVVGYLRQESGGYSSPMVALALALLCSAAIVLTLGRYMMLRKAHAS